MSFLALSSVVRNFFFGNKAIKISITVYTHNCAVYNFLNIMTRSRVGANNTKRQNGIGLK